VGPHAEPCVVEALREAEELLPQVVRRRELPPMEIKSYQTQQDREELRGVAELPAQLARPGVGGFHFRRRMPPGEDQRDAEGGEEREFLLGALGAVRQGGEQGQRRGQVADGLDMRRALAGALARPLPVGQSLG
jgi:hypothetical protein